MKRRSRTDIILDILVTAREGASKTEIVYKANLNFNLAKQYLELLERGGLIKSDKNPYFIYKTTDYGQKYLQKAKEIDLR